MNEGLRVPIPQISFEAAGMLFAQQYDANPDIDAEWVRLSGGVVGPMTAIRDGVIEAMRFDPDTPLTPALMRSYVGVPDDPAAFAEWQRSYYQKWKAKKAQTDPSLRTAQRRGLFRLRGPQILRRG